MVRVDVDILVHRALDGGGVSQIRSLSHGNRGEVQESASPEVPNSAWRVWLQEAAACAGRDSPCVGFISVCWKCVGTVRVRGGDADNIELQTIQYGVSAFDQVLVTEGPSRRLHG